MCLWVCVRVRKVSFSAFVLLHHCLEPMETLWWLPGAQAHCLAQPMDAEGEGAVFPRAFFSFVPEIRHDTYVVPWIRQICC